MLLNPIKVYYARLFPVDPLPQRIMHLTFFQNYYFYIKKLKFCISQNKLKIALKKIKLKKKVFYIIIFKLKKNTKKIN